MLACCTGSKVGTDGISRKNLRSWSEVPGASGNRSVSKLGQERQTKQDIQPASGMNSSVVLHGHLV